MTYEILPGTVYIVGAGPGAPDLITMRGHAVIAAADLVLYADSLVEEAVAQLARKPDARLIATSTMHLEQIVPLMIEAAQVGAVVARVHSGDPALYGATHEQMVALHRAGVRYEVVPGVPSAFAAAARLGVELTVPELAQTIILTRAAGRVALPPGEELSALAAHGTTLAIHLSVTRMRQVVAELLAGGRYTPETPIAVLHRVSWPDESLVTGTLADIAERVRAAGYTRQAVILVGPALDTTLHERENQAVSHLYNQGYTHRFRRGEQQKADGNQSAVGGRQSAGNETAQEAVGAHHASRIPHPASLVTTQNSTPIPHPASRIPHPPLVISVTRRGSALAVRLASELGAEVALPARFAEDEQNAYTGSVLDEIRRQWAQRRALVLVLATGVAVRAIAPLIEAKTNDPAVVCVDEAGHSVIPLLGGHQAGANDLARQIAAITGGHAAITTASDGQGKPALDQLGREAGWRIDPDSALTHASACLINDEPVGVYLDPALTAIQAQANEWLAQAENLVQVDALADLLSEDYAAALVVSHRMLGEDWGALRHKSVLYRPPVLVAGMGCRRGVPADELATALITTLDEAGLARESLAALATADLKADEPGLHALAVQLGVPLQIISHERLAALDPTQFSQSAATARFDLPGVAEPSALLASNGVLLLPKRAFERCTVAVAMWEAGGGRQGVGDEKAEGRGQKADRDDRSRIPHPASRILALVSLGPGDPRQMTVAAREALEAAEVVIGYRGYLEQVSPLLRPEQETIALALGDEVERARRAIDLAAAGRRVALISSGDIGVYAMAAPVFEELRARGWNGTTPQVAVFPGVSAVQAAAAQLGAPLGHDFCTVSLSDLLTPWTTIERRVDAAARGDFVIAFYNPRSRERDWQLAAALDILREHRPLSTPIALVRNVSRPDEAISLTTLAEIDPSVVDMFTLVLVGSSQSFLVAEHIVTPRGYAITPAEEVQS